MFPHFAASETSTGDVCECVRPPLFNSNITIWSAIENLFQFDSIDSLYLSIGPIHFIFFVLFVFASFERRFPSEDLFTPIYYHIFDVTFTINSTSCLN